MAEDDLYQAFILYPDSPPEKKAAEQVEREIRKFKIPLKIKSPLSAKDLQKTTSLGVPMGNSADGIAEQVEEQTIEPIAEKTEDVLRRSRFLVVICSPRAVAIPKITTIIQRFIALGKREQILTLLVSGTPAESFPPILFGASESGEKIPGQEYQEPLAANICAKDEKSSFKRLKDFEKYRILAPILGCEFYDLKQTHLAWERQNSWLKILAVSLALFLVGTFFLSRALAVHSEINRLESYQKLNTDVISELCLSIPDSLKRIPGAELMLQEVIWSRADIQQLIKDRLKSASTGEREDGYDLRGTRITDDGRKQILRGFSRLKERDFDRLLFAFDDISPSEGIDDFFIRLFIACQENKLRYREDFKTIAKMNGVQRAADFDIQLFIAHHENELRNLDDFKGVAQLIEKPALMKRSFGTALLEFLERAGKWMKRIKIQRILQFLDDIR